MRSIALFFLDDFIVNIFGFSIKDFSKKKKVLSAVSYIYICKYIYM